MVQLRTCLFILTLVILICGSYSQCEYSQSGHLPYGQQNSYDERRIRKFARRVRMGDYLKCVFSSNTISIFVQDDHPVNVKYYGNTANDHKQHKTICPFIQLDPEKYTEPDSFDLLKKAFLELVYTGKNYPNTYRPNIDLQITYPDLVKYHKQYCDVPSIQYSYIHTFIFIVQMGITASMCLW